MSNNDTLVNFKINAATLEQAKAQMEHGEMSQRLRETLEAVAHGTEVAEETRLTDRLQTLREERRSLRQQRDNVETDLDEVNRKIERVEQRLDSLREQDGQYDGVLAMLEEDLHSGVRILGGSDKIKRAAELGDCSVDEVIEDLKERNPEVPEKAFRPAQAGEPADWQSDKTESLL